MPGDVAKYPLDAIRVCREVHCDLSLFVDLNRRNFTRRLPSSCVPETIRDFLLNYQSKDEGAKYMDMLVRPVYCSCCYSMIIYVCSLVVSFLPLSIKVSATLPNLTPPQQEIANRNKRVLDIELSDILEV